MSLAVITMKTDISVKNALDSRKLNGVTVKRKTQVPIIEESIARLSRKIAVEPADKNWISQFDLDPYSQLKRSKRAIEFGIFAILVHQ